MQGENLIIANLGDSRAILATKTEDDGILPVQLTTDLKPGLPSKSFLLLSRFATKRPRPSKLN